MRDGVVLRRHVPGLETVDIDWCLPLHQRRLSFESRRNEKRRLGCAEFGVGLRQTF